MGEIDLHSIGVYQWMWKQFKTMNNVMAANWSSLNISTIYNFLFINLFGPGTNQLDLTKCAILWLAKGRRSAWVAACLRWEIGAVSNIYVSRLKHLLCFILDIIHLTKLMFKYICIMYLFLVKCDFYIFCTNHKFYLILILIYFHFVNFFLLWWRAHFYVFRY